MGSISDSQLDTIGSRIINKGDGNRVTRSNARCIENGVTSLESRDRLNSMAGKREKNLLIKTLRFSLSITATGYEFLMGRTRSTRG